MVARRSLRVVEAQLAQGDLLGVVVVLLLAGEPGAQHLAVLAHDHRADREGRLRRRAQPGQLDRPAQEPAVGTAGAEQVPQYGHAFQPLDPGEGHGVLGTVRAGLGVEAGGGGVGDEERGDGQVQLVGKVAGQELSQDVRAAFDQETSHAPFGQIRKDEIEGQGVTGVDDHGAVPDPGAGVAQGPGGAVDQAVGAGGEEAGPGIQVAGGGEGDPGGVLGQAAGGAAGAAARVADQQPGVVLADRARADQDRVAAGPDLVHAVQVGRAGQDQALRAGVVEVAVGRDGAAQQDIRAWRHRTPWFGLAPA